MADEFDVEGLATSFAHMARHLLAQDSVGSTLDRIAAHATLRIDGCQEASIVVLDANRQLSTVASTGDLGRESDRIQAELGEGPHFEVAENYQEVYRIADMGGSGDRWPRYAPKARALGIGSMMGFLLFTAWDRLGTLNLYSSRPNAFTKRSEQVGWIFASHAAVAFAAARNDAQLHEAIATRQGIGEAMGIIMNRHKTSEEQAFEVLKKSSQEHHVKLRDIARQVTETGEIPE
ncbi:GAF domain-containing protein [Halopolyspora algeriensis]|uniref:GAF domain-containing protein n=1 Tax=Halopolyspora algeriensis TaxID=1500506 RepID=A0A368VWA1_9ACTN|nr:GAF and ANTAR domain-containing protein [Halopolyspora algeriensis]RCW43683.1 GAF domain-containing protein [Halopolyspora algeriensis]TQM47533.1 GAF domain-containing protein [Halopolyspora algeriensis]